MWNDVLRTIYAALRRSGAAEPDLERAGVLLSLSEDLGSLQSQPDEFALTVQRAIDASELGHRDSKFLDEINVRMHGHALFTASELFVMASLGELAEMLESGWAQFYEPISHGYTELNSRLELLRESLGTPAFGAALGKLSLQWKVGDDRIFDWTAMTFVRVCAMIGVVDPTGALYRDIATLLSLKQEFLTVWLAGACLKVKAIAGSFDLADMTDEQYACMKMLDRFTSLQGISWG
jgi:hypothetical protein